MAPIGGDRGASAPVVLRRRHSGTSRQQLIRQAALELFAAVGYRATTIDEIGRRAGIKGPTVYKHVRSKQSLLVDIMTGTMDELLSLQQDALARSADVRVQLHDVVAAHVSYHAEHAHEAFVGTREISSLEEPYQSLIVAKRGEYEGGLRRLIERGVAAGTFRTASARIAAYSILDMGMGVSVWFRPDGPVSEQDVAERYAQFALRMVHAAPP